MLECVINISEGRRPETVDAIAAAAEALLLDVHRDGHHNRAVLTLAGGGSEVETAARAVAAEAVARIDLRGHSGVHPRIGALDVVPFVPLGETPLAAAVAARDRFARWAGAELALPCFLYGPERSLPDIRRQAFTSSLWPDCGPPQPHPTAGGCAVGARPVLVAYNLWLATAGLEEAKAIAARLRGPAVRALGLWVGDAAQVSMNLLSPGELGPDAAFDAVAAHAAVARAELVGLLPASVLDATPKDRWARLGLDQSRTIEARLERAGLG